MPESKPTITHPPLEHNAIALKNQRVHFVGIGGCGMSGLARIALERGAKCTGTDLAASPLTDALIDQGVDILFKQQAGSVPDDCQLLVRSAAVTEDHPEVREANRRGIRTIKYAQMLGELMLGQVGVAVAGTHGKSTTTSLLCHILIECDLDPSFIVGANCPQIGGGSRVGQSDLLIAEACEYDRSFHNLHPTHSMILNVEQDHLDCYPNIDAIIESFATFAKLVPDDGSLLINHETSHRMAITAGLLCQVQTLGFSPQADWQVKLDSTTQGLRVPELPTTRLLHRGEQVATWRCTMPGEHMAYNAAAAAVMAHRLGGEWSQIANAIESFRGLDRRMQSLGRHHQIDMQVVDDYGHHPTEIDTTLRALRRHYSPKRLICVFQPHQHSRTRFLLDQFATSFSEADVVIVPHIYFVRDSEQERHTVAAGDLVDRLRQRDVQAMHLYPFDAIVEQLQLMAQPGDLLVTMGAGDVWQIAQAFLQTTR